jgi:hypothetical protein
MPTTLEIGQKLAELTRQGKNLEAIDALYAQNIVSLEAISMGPVPARLDGFEAVRNKSVWWLANHDVHGMEVNGPWPHGDRFIVTMKVDATAKTGPMAGQRMTFEEAALYTVKDGKIVQEEYFYHMG